MRAALREELLAEQPGLIDSFELRRSCGKLSIISSAHCAGKQAPIDLMMMKQHTNCNRPIHLGRFLVRLDPLRACFGGGGSNKCLLAPLQWQTALIRRSDSATARAFVVVRPATTTCGLPPHKRFLARLRLNPAQENWPSQTGCHWQLPLEPFSLNLPLFVFATNLPPPPAETGCRRNKWLA